MTPLLILTVLIHAYNNVQKTMTFNVNFYHSTVSTSASTEPEGKIFQSLLIFMLYLWLVFSYISFLAQLLVGLMSHLFLSHTLSSRTLFDYHCCNCVSRVSGGCCAGGDASRAYHNCHLKQKTQQSFPVQRRPNLQWTCHQGCCLGVSSYLVSSYTEHISW